MDRLPRHREPLPGLPRVARRGPDAVIHRLIVGLACAVAIAPSLAAQGLPHIVFKTERGEIEMEIDTVRAPISGNNFLRYVDGGFFTNGSFYRVVRPDNQPNDSIRIGVIQGGQAREKRGQGFPAIELERTSVTGIKHVDGTISMARAGVTSATSSFFICLGDQPSLDFGGMRNPDGQGFAAFGRVVRGLDVARRIQGEAANGQNLVAPVVIHNASRVK
ncbi:MAG: peptidylprolyl isomerase [Cytophagaceae bacterium]|nr:peptidylprolyl isomerase [Gemmatimonadaceae bacterium]